MKELVVGIDIGGTNTKFGLVDQDGTIVTESKTPTNSQQAFEGYTKALWSEILKIYEPLSNEYTLRAVGVGAPNANSHNGKIENPPNLAWDEADLVSIFSKVMMLPVKLENDANIAAVGEKIFGLGKNFDNFIVITLGTGIGTGTYINGELFTGSHALGSEAGHMTIYPGGRVCGCGGKGHLECYGSVRGIKQTCQEILGEDLKFAEISERFHKHDKLMDEVVRQTAKYLAIGMSNMSSLISPQAFIFAGGISTLGERFRQMIIEEYRKVVYTPFRNNSQVLISEISSEYGAILGAASLVM